MADFTPSSETKSAVRKLANPLADVTAFDTIVQGVVTTNPFQCVGYNSGGIDHPPVERTKAGYTARIVYQDALAKTTGTGSHRFNSIAGFNAGVTALLGSGALTAAHTGTAVRDQAGETYSASLNCRDPNGENYTVTINRNRVNLTSYSDDAIRTKVETWADSVPALA